MPRIPLSRSFFWRDPPPPPYISTAPTPDHSPQQPPLSPSTSSWETPTAFQTLLTSWETFQPDKTPTPKPSPRPPSISAAELPAAAPPNMVNWTLSEDGETMTYSTATCSHAVPAKVYYSCGDAACEFLLEQLHQRERLERYIQKKRDEHWRYVLETDDALQELKREVDDARGKLRDMRGRFRWLAEGMGFYEGV